MVEKREFLLMRVFMCCSQGLYTVRQLQRITENELTYRIRCLRNRRKLNVICKHILDAAGGHPGSVDKIPAGLDAVYIEETR